MDTKIQRLDADEVRRRAAGRWDQILRSLAPELHDALDKPKKHFPCPVHGGKDGLRVFKNVAETGGVVCNTCGPKADGFATLRWLKGWTFPEALREVDAVLGGGPAVLVPVVTLPAKQVDRAARDQRNADLREYTKKLWAESAPIMDEKAEVLRRYLNGRGLAVTEDIYALRLHPSLPYVDEDGKFVARYPAMIARVAAPDNARITLHRTYLTEDGHKAPVESAKKVLPYPDDLTMHGAAIRVSRSAVVLGISEGIETALAVTELFDIPCWAAINATLLGGFEPPAETQWLMVFADKDVSQAGERAADTLWEKMLDRGIRFTVHYPPIDVPEGEKGVDWLDYKLACSAPGKP
ncbi:DUF7146 domain-containing protein [Thiobacillus denitrificans]|uniref:DUF7146 domain-containing protein n=1 Tax=Thiobacillus denitrificans TaxID=36861 RepID=UPI0003805AD3|nr:toprim domain-containing protein [Thiobacillus denitrificans]